MPWTTTMLGATVGTVAQITLRAPTPTGSGCVSERKVRKQKKGDGMQTAGTTRSGPTTHSVMIAPRCALPPPPRGCTQQSQQKRAHRSTEPSRTCDRTTCGSRSAGIPTAVPLQALLQL